MVFVWLLFYLQFIVIPKGGIKTSGRVREPRYLAGFHIYYKNYRVQQAQADEKTQSATHSGG